MLYLRQTNILFLLFAHDIENSLEHFILHSHIQPISQISYILLHVNVSVTYYYLFLPYFQVLTH